MPEAFEIVGVARRFLGKSFASDMKDGILQYGGVNADDPKLEVFLEKIHYFAMNFDDSADYDGLKRKLESLDKEKGTAGNRLFYLATDPEYFAPIVEGLAAAELTYGQAGEGHCPHDCGEAFRARSGVGARVE